MKKFTYSLAALTVALSVNAYANSDDIFEIPDIADESEIIHEDTDKTITDTIGPNITNAEIEAENKTLFKDTPPPAETTHSRTETIPSAPETNEFTIINPKEKEEERITESTSLEETSNLPLNISNEEIAAAGLPLVVDEVETSDPIPVSERIKESTSKEESDKIQPNISDEELAALRKESGAEFYRETRNEHGNITPIDRPALVNPKPKKTYDQLQKEKQNAETAEKQSLADLESGKSVEDPIPEHERIKAEQSVAPKIEKPQAKPEANADPKVITHENHQAQTKPVVAVVNAFTSTVNANLALSSISSRLAGSRSNDSQSHTASLTPLLPSMAKQSGLWVNTKYGKTQQRNEFTARNWGIQIGFDHPFNTADATLKLGAAVDLEKGKSAIGTDRLRSDIYGITLYGAYEMPENHYVDFFARTAQASNKLTGANSFHTLQHAVGLTYSTLVDVSNTWSFEPKAQLAYSHIGSSRFVKDQVSVYVKPINSLTGQLGLKTNFNLNKQFATYAKVELNKELSSKKAGTVGNVAFVDNSKASWATLGLGVKSQMNANSSLFFDVETQLGQGYRNTYQLNLGVNVKF